MRGIAAMLVLAFHIIFYSPFNPVLFPTNYDASYAALVMIAILLAGYSGVYLFFIISGYILAKKLESRDYDVNNKFNRIKYYLRRIFRTWPLYFLVIPVFAFFTVGSSNSFSWLSFFFIQNFFPSTFINNPTWTLMVEEVFYLVLPLWILVFRKNWKVAFAGAGILTLGYMAFVQFVLGQVSAYAFAQFPAFALTFALGMLVAYNKKIRVHWILIAAAWLFVSYNFSNIFGEGSFTFLPVILFSGIYFLVVCNLTESRVFKNRASLFLGKLAYPIYLFGLPVQFSLIIILGDYNPLWVLLTIPLTIAASYAINRFIEKPFINLGSGLNPTC